MPRIALRVARRRAFSHQVLHAGEIIFHVEPNPFRPRRKLFEPLQITLDSGHFFSFANARAFLFEKSESS